MDGRGSATFKSSRNRFWFQIIGLTWPRIPISRHRVPGRPQQNIGAAMQVELTSTKHQHRHRLLFALAAAVGLGLGLALIAFFDAWYSGSGFTGMQVIGVH